MSRRIRELDTTEVIDSGTFVAVDNGSKPLAEKFDLSKLLNTRTVRTEVQTAHSFTVGTVVRHTGSAWARAIANNPQNAAALGVVSAVIDADTFEVTTGGFVTGLTGLTAGQMHYVNPTVSGMLTTITPHIKKEVLFALTANSGLVLNSSVEDNRPPTVVDVTTPARNLAGNATTTFTQAIPALRFVGVTVTVSGLAVGSQLRIRFSGDSTHENPQYVGEFTPALFQDLSQGWRYRDLTHNNLIYIMVESLTGTAVSGYTINIVGEPF